MRKTSVYLTDEESEGLQRIARTTGKSQSELIREGLRRLFEEAENQPRRFASMGMGGGDWQPYARWDAADSDDNGAGAR
jgi:Arc/MetJ-type ribon-helix-helix transcriptional regulator